MARPVAKAKAAQCRQTVRWRTQAYKNISWFCSNSMDRLQTATDRQQNSRPFETRQPASCHRFTGLTKAVRRRNHTTVGGGVTRICALFVEMVSEAMVTEALPATSIVMAHQLVQKHVRTVLTIKCSDVITAASEKLVSVQRSMPVLTKNNQMIGLGHLYIDLLVAKPLCLRLVGLRSGNPLLHGQDIVHPPSRRNGDTMLLCDCTRRSYLCTIHGNYLYPTVCRVRREA